MNKVLYLLFIVITFILKNTPQKFLKKISHTIANILWQINTSRKRIVLKNLEIAFPNKSKSEHIEIAKETYKNYLYYFADIVKSMNISKEDLEQKVTIKGQANLEEALNSNKPIIFMTAHFGNWEIAPKIIGAFYKPMVVLMREFDNPKIGEFFKNSRSSFNITPINKNGSAREILKAFKQDKALGILIDQHTNSDKAIDVEFFKKKVKFNRSISTFADKFGAVIVPMFSYLENDRYILEFLEPKTFEGSTIESFTQWQATTIENMIKKHPSEYYWFHKRFKNIKGIYD